MGFIHRGTHKGGHEFFVTAQQLIRAIEEIQRARRVHKYPILNIVFDLPGDLGDLEYSGQRFGPFSTKVKILNVETAVPNDVLLSSDHSQFVLRSLRAAVNLAESKFKKSGLDFDAQAHLGCIGEVEREPRDRQN